MSFGDVDAIAQAELVRSGQVHPRELVRSAVDRIAATDPEVNAITALCVERALAEAEAAPIGQQPFAGVPTLVKALNEAEGLPYNLGSAWVAKSGRMGRRDNTLIARMRAAGFIVVGQTSTPEFGVVSVSESKVHGATRNPWRLDLTSGGSSGGASAAVAAGMVPVAQGGDGGGSIRMPAAFCHLVGLKPTVGRISGGPGLPTRWGHSVPAVVTRSVRDTAAVLDAVSGGSTGDLADPYWPDGGMLAQVGRDPGRLRIGVLTHAPDHAAQVTESVADAVDATATLLAGLGHDVGEAWPAALMEPEQLAMFFDALSVTVSQGIDSFAAELGGPPAPGELDVITEHWERRGRAISGMELAHALEWLNSYRARMVSWWAEGYDLLLCPVFASAPRPVGWPWSEPDGVQQTIDVLTFTAPFNTSGQPAISVPAAISAQGEPIGVQLVADLGREDRLLAVAAQIEAERPWAHLRPPVFAA